MIAPRKATTFTRISRLSCAATAGIGAPGMRCTTCHGPANFDPGHIPGNPKWQTRAYRDGVAGQDAGRDLHADQGSRKRNGGQKLEALIPHMAEDELVGWGWHPGVGRTPAPGTQKQFGELIKAWVEAGAACPDS